MLKKKDTTTSTIFFKYFNINLSAYGSEQEIFSEASTTRKYQLVVLPKLIGDHSNSFQFINQVVRTCIITR